MRFQPASMSRDDIECTPIVKRDDNENTCGTSASCDIDNPCIAFSRTARIVARMHCRVAGERAPRVVIHPRQHFLKQDSVFFDALVYSGCSASRFPSARSK